jgi:acetylornithine aminotransferase
LNDVVALETELKKGDVSSVIVEAIQGVGGLDEGTPEFFKQLETLCKHYGVLLILDEVQSGYGRSGKFFAFQHHNIQPDIITIAKGMGNGFPIGGVLIGKHIQAYHGMLGTTFGGNHLACAAAISVLDVLEKENLMDNVTAVSDYFVAAVKDLKGLQKIKGKGLMIGLEFDEEVGELRKKLIYDEHIFTGGSMNKKLLRILPPLNVSIAELQPFVKALKKIL